MWQRWALTCCYGKRGVRDLTPLLQERWGSLPVCSFLPSPDSQMSVKAMAMAQLHFTHTEMQFQQMAVSDCSAGIEQPGISS